MSVRHPNVVELLDTYEGTASFTIITELLEGALLEGCVCMILHVVPSLLFPTRVRLKVAVGSRKIRMDSFNLSTYHEHSADSILDVRFLWLYWRLLSMHRRF